MAEKRKRPSRAGKPRAVQTSLQFESLAAELDAAPVEAPVEAPAQDLPEPDPGSPAEAQVPPAEGPAPTVETGDISSRLSERLTKRVDRAAERIARFKDDVAALRETIAEHDRATHATALRAARAAEAAEKRVRDAEAIVAGIRGEHHLFERQVRTWMRDYPPHRVLEEYKEIRRAAGIIKREIQAEHMLVRCLVEQNLVLTGVSSAMDAIVRDPAKQAAVLRSLLWTFDQGAEWWRRHYRDERTIEQWARWAVEEARLGRTQEGDRWEFKDRAPGWNAPVAEEGDEDDEPDEPDEPVNAELDDDESED